MASVFSHTVAAFGIAACFCPSRAPKRVWLTAEPDETGKVLRKSANRINLDFTPEQYASYLKSRFTFHQFIQPQEGVTTLRIVVEDPSTAEVGSLIIPLSQLK